MEASPSPTSSHDYGYPGCRGAPTDHEVEHDSVHQYADDESDDGPEHLPVDPDSVPVGLLFEHLVAAKRALSTVTLVKHADDLCTEARELHEEAVIRETHTHFVKQGTLDQIAVLQRVCRRQGQIARAYNDDLFDNLIPQMDKVGKEFFETADKLKGIPVDAVLRPSGEEPKCLFDFVSDENAHQYISDIRSGIDSMNVSQPVPLVTLSYHEADLCQHAAILCRLSERNSDAI